MPEPIKVRVSSLSYIKFLIHNIPELRNLNNYKFNEETNIIKRALMDLNNMNITKVDEIMELAKKKEKESNQIVEFTQKIKRETIDFKLKIIEILWKIVYSDGADDNYESNLIRRVCGLLYISDKDSGIIKLKVKNSIK